MCRNPFRIVLSSQRKEMKAKIKFAQKKGGEYKNI